MKKQTKETVLYLCVCVPLSIYTTYTYIHICITLLVTLKPAIWLVKTEMFCKYKIPTRFQRLKYQTKKNVNIAHK